MKLTSAKIIEAIRRSVPILHRIPEELKPTLDRMFEADNARIDRERFNIILSAWRISPASKCFFTYYFTDAIEDIEGLIDGIHHFFKDALWHFGDIRRAFKVLRELPDIAAYIRHHEFSLADFHNRLPWTLVEVIAPEERGFLGYVSGQRAYQQRDALTLTERVLRELDQNRSAYEGLSSKDVQAKIVARLPDAQMGLLGNLNQIESLEDMDLFSLSETRANADMVRKTMQEITQTIERVEKLKKIGESNQVHYLRNIETIDVYVATSMRDDREYVEMASFVEEVFGDTEIVKLNLRYFDPTLCYCDSRIDKGIIECLLVRTAKLTIYCAQEGDTFGKDSELAATLCQGKPVIVYVPQDESDPERQAQLDKRAKVFQEFHPLGLQVGLYDGVARGVIVVRSPTQCSRILLKVLTNALEVDVRFEQHGVVLRERETQSVLRIMTGWDELAHSFWSNFGVSINPKSGLPE